VGEKGEKTHFPFTVLKVKKEEQGTPNRRISLLLKKGKKIRPIPKGKEKRRPNKPGQVEKEEKPLPSSGGAS